MKLQTTIPLEPSKNQIDYDSKLLLVGSCFVENIGGKLEYFKFQNLVNPFGILFHPEAIARVFERASSQKPFTTADLECVNEQYVSFDAHSHLNGISEEEALHNLSAAQKRLFNQLQTASHVVITLGTAWGYRNKKENKIVANCHKIPQKEFEKTLASVDEIEDALHRILKVIESINTQAIVLFTVSPVRHIKDGFVENQRSKAHLLAAVHSVIEKTERAEYFPSYELMMDELRDYRFYDRDLIHPNEIAVDYIWERFVDVYFSPKALKLTEEVAEIQRGLAHRPFNAASKQHKIFIAKLAEKIELLQTQVSHIQF